MGVGQRIPKSEQRAYYPSGPRLYPELKPPRIVEKLVEVSKKRRIKKDINPQPDNWKIVKAVESNGYTILKINYPNCTNYEGNKILVYKAALIDIVNQKLIDPHFMDDPKYISPIARFVPTDEGWDMALSLTGIVLKD